MHIAAIGRGLAGIHHALTSYRENLHSATVREQHRIAGRKQVMVLQTDVERARRGTEYYAMPGCTHALLLGALVFERKENVRAKQGFAVAVDRDLVYVTDPRHCDLFLRLWGGAWCKKVQYLAILVVDCKVQMEWYNSNIAARARHMWPFQGHLFAESELKEITLVVRPAVNPHKLPDEDHYRRDRLLAHPRDVYGFVDYQRLRGDPDVFSTIDSLIIRQNFKRYRTDLRKMMPDEMKQKITIRFAVDLDCESIGMTNVEGEGAVYKRSQRN
jgi:hypothetical protein